MPFKAYYLNVQGELESDLSEDAVKAAFGSRDGVLWVDLQETDEQDGEFLRRVFNFHPLAVEDCVSKDIHPPKVDDFGDYMFMVFHGIDYTLASEVVETSELGIFLGPHFVVSNHNLPLFSVEAVRSRVESNTRLISRGAVFLAHALIDNVLPTIDRMGEVIDEIEREVVQIPQQQTLDTILKLKRSTLQLHRVMAPQRDVLNRLSRGDFPIIGQDVRIFYRDIYDHTMRIDFLNQSVREMADSALATYLSSVANRQNEVMKVLSTVATIFMPLTLIAGIYGMNFKHMPELAWPWAYYAALSVMAVIVAIVLLSFWLRRWFVGGRSRLMRARLFAVDPRRLVGHPGHIQRRPSRQ